jgi:hypothetical protein
MDNMKISQGLKDDPTRVAWQGFDALVAGEGKTIAGLARTKAQGIASKVLPDQLKAATHRRMAEPESGK